MSESTILAYSNYIKFHNSHLAAFEYEQFLEHIIDNSLFDNNNFKNKFFILFLKIENLVTSIDHHFVVYKQLYAEILQNITHIQLLKSGTILCLYFEVFQKHNMFENEIGNTLDVSIKTFGICLQHFKNIFHVHKTIPKPISNVLKNILFDDTNIDLLLLLLGKLQFDETDIEKLRKKYTNLQNNKEIMDKLLSSDTNVITLINKLFPNVLKNNLVENFEKFTEKTKCLINYPCSSNCSETESVKKELEVLITLKKINDSDKFICGICCVHFIENIYNCNHTICTNCMGQTPSKCPYCRAESTCKPIFLSS